MQPADNRTITSAAFNGNQIADKDLPLLQDTSTVDCIKAFAAKFFNITPTERVRINVNSTTETITVQILNSATGAPQGLARVLQKQNGNWTYAHDSSVPKNQQAITAGADYILTKVQNAYLQSQPGGNTGGGGQGGGQQSPVINVFYPGSQGPGMTHSHGSRPQTDRVPAMQAELRQLRQQLRDLDDGDEDEQAPVINRRIQHLQDELANVDKPQRAHHKPTKYD